jgi:lactate dehydrogenase-like 2-hydroxyacid dehydrogenase
MKQAMKHLPLMIMSRALPFAPVDVSGTPIETKVFEGDFNVFEGASVYCSTVFDPVQKNFIDQFPASVGLIANIGVGFDNIDLNAAKARGIMVSNTPVVTEDTADLAFGLILSTCRRMSENERFLRSGEWSFDNPIGMLGSAVHGKTLGIIGFGAIGQAVARRAKGFNMDILYHGPNQKPEAEETLGASYCTNLNDLLGKADIVSLHCQMNDNTRGIINAASLAAMKKGSTLINSGRGPLVNEADLVDALTSGHLGAAGLDVFEFEPKVAEALLDFKNVTLLPHIGSATVDCRNEMGARALGNALQYITEGTIRDRVV